MPGAAGVWRDLTNNVNELAGNLTGQVRAIRDVATAVTQGDLTRSISVEARGEIAQLKDSVNQMIQHPGARPRRSTRSRTGSRPTSRASRACCRASATCSRWRAQVLSELAPLVNAQHGAFYMDRERDNEGRCLCMLRVSYAYMERRTSPNTFPLRRGAWWARPRSRASAIRPHRGARRTTSRSSSGPRRGAADTRSWWSPILFEEEVKGVIELTSFAEVQRHPARVPRSAASRRSASWSATIEATMRTDELLRQSQRLTEELRRRSRRSCSRPTRSSRRSARPARRASRRPRSSRRTSRSSSRRQELEEKAEQLALTSKYKSQFLANMSHELRTPLNKLADPGKPARRQPRGQPDRRADQVTPTRSSSAGNDLLTLINDILDLVEDRGRHDGGRRSRRSPVRRTCATTSTGRSASSPSEKGPRRSRSSSTPSCRRRSRPIRQRLPQILKNLLSNALKFTETGRASRCEIDRAGARDRSRSRCADTGIGIPGPARVHLRGVPAGRRRDATASSAAPASGLSISREIARPARRRPPARERAGPRQHVHARRCPPGVRGAGRDGRATVAAGGAGRAPLDLALGPERSPPSRRPRRLRPRHRRDAAAGAPGRQLHPIPPTLSGSPRRRPRRRAPAAVPRRPRHASSRVAARCS